MNELNKFYKSFMQDIVATQYGDEEGNTQEHVFTQICEDMLAEAGETENITVAYDECDIGKKGQHKINGYAISDNYENVDLFISIYNNESEIKTVYKADIDTAAKRITNFFRTVIYNDYSNKIAESSEIFKFANTLANYQELKEHLIRINAFILTNGEYKGEIPPPHSVSGYTIYYRVIDINFLFQISEHSRVPIELDLDNLDGKSYEVPCLAANTDNTDYKAYVAIISGECLATLYHNYGARLLEQNVRSFLQFTGKINKGIRDTIKNEPHMFLAFNNGIAATADHIELDESGHRIKRISNLQIVNGGQTTASIFTTARKEKVDLSQIYVQIKLSVITDKTQYAYIVSRISKYANTQNKVNDADFTANNPALVEIEKFSRFVLTPTTSNNNIQTCWFFERARGQYKTLRAKDGFTKSRRAAFDMKYPRRQVITKVELAKYINAWEEKCSGKSIVVGPHIVVRGNEKNYARFINYNLPNAKDIDIAYYEDVVAKAILFKTADKRYGTKLSGNPIGEMKQVVVPYTLSLLNILTNGKLDLYKIWKNQQVSTELSNFIYNLMTKVNAFILCESPISHYIEWAKKEECWLKVKENQWDCNVKDISNDCIDENNLPMRIHKKDAVEDEDIQYQQKSIVEAIPFSLWKKIAAWGSDTGLLRTQHISAASDIAFKLKNRHQLQSTDVRKGYSIYEIVWQYNPELLDESDKLITQDIEDISKITQPEITDITLELVQQMVQWDKRKRVLDDWKWKVMKDVADGLRPLTNRMKYAFYMNLQTLKRKGFPD